MRKCTIGLLGIVFCGFVISPCGHAAIDYKLVADIHISIRDAGGQVIATGGPWAYQQYGSYSLSGVPAGAGRSLHVWTTDSSDSVTYAGSAGNVDILADSPILNTATLRLDPDGDRIKISYPGFNTELVAISLVRMGGGAEQLNVDVKPGSESNPINLGAKGVLPVAVFGSVDVTTAAMDAMSLRLAGVAALRHTVEDSNADGKPDLLLHFSLPSIAATLGSHRAGQTVKLTLKGKLRDGTSVEGHDTVTIVGGSSGKKK